MQILALGDSYTIGEGVPTCDRWIDMLVDQLRQKEFEVQALKVIATTGWTSDELLCGVDDVLADSFPPSDAFDLVTLLIGVNNQYRGYSLDKYEADLKILLNRAVLYAGGNADRVVAISIPDYGLTPFAKNKGLDQAKIARELDQYNAVAEHLVAQRNMAWADITSCSRQHGCDANMVVEDDLHPSRAMHELWTRQILPFAVSCLTKED